MNAGGANNFSVVRDIPSIMYVDDERTHLNSLKSLLNGTINILTAGSGNREEFLFRGRIASGIEPIEFDLAMSYKGYN
jgi:hypothetical protein